MPAGRPGRRHRAKPKGPIPRSSKPQGGRTKQVPRAVDRLAADRDCVTHSCCVILGCRKKGGLARTHLIPTTNRTRQGGEGAPPAKAAAPGTCWALLRADWSRCQNISPDTLIRPPPTNTLFCTRPLPSPLCWTCEWPRKTTHTANPPPAVSGSRSKWLFLPREQRRAAAVCHRAPASRL